MHELMNEGYSYEEVKDICMHLLLKKKSDLEAISIDDDADPLIRRVSKIFLENLDGSLLFLLNDHFKLISPNDIRHLYYGDRKN